MYILDSGATTTTFQDKKKNNCGIYQKGSTDTVELTVGAEEIDSLKKGTISFKNIELKNSVHVNRLYKSLYPAGKICDTGQIVVCTKSEAVVINYDCFSVIAVDIDVFAGKSPGKSLRHQQIFFSED